jgi:hypothetical protein
MQVVMERAQELGDNPLANPARFLIDVGYYHRAGARPYRPDTGVDRTSGIGTGSGGYQDFGRHPNDDDDGLVGDLRAIQRKGGFY